MQPELHTQRLRLRPPRGEHLEPLVALNQDPRVLEHLPGPVPREACAAWIARNEAHLAEHGFGVLAVELAEPRGEGAFVGLVGLAVPRFEAPFTPCVEVLWRIRSELWGRGHATEAARAVLADGFGRVGLEEVVSFTVPANRRSLAVMERLGFERDPDGDFLHPALPTGHRLAPHQLHRLGRERWSLLDPARRR